MAYSKELQSYIEYQPKRPDWNRDKIDGLMGEYQYDRLENKTYVIFNYKKNKVVAHGLEVCKVRKPNPNWANKCHQHTIVEVWKNDKLNFFVPWLKKDALILKEWADGVLPMCCMGNKFTLRINGEYYRLNLDKSAKLTKGQYHLWTIEDDND